MRFQHRFGRISVLSARADNGGKIQKGAHQAHFRKY
jgi:hypothetical protein